MIKHKILHLRASNFYGGPERQLHFHALLAKDTKFALTISSFTENNKEPEFLNILAQDGISTHVFKVKNAYDISAIKKVRRYIIENAIDILCTHEYRTHLIGFLATRGTIAKWLAFSLGWTRETFLVRLYNCIDRVILRFADHIIAVSQSQEKLLLRQFISPKKISVIYVAVNSEELAKAEKVDLRKRFNLPDDSFVCMAAGRFSLEKGQAFLVEAAALALERDKRLRFILFGDGLELAKVKAKINELGCDNKIICPGFEKNIAGCLKGADCLINPSLTEGLPNIILEAMALEIPVIATSVGGVPELIENNVNGIMVSYGDSERLAEAIIRLAQDTEGKDSYCRSAKATVTNKYSFQTQMMAYGKIYSQLIDGASENE